MQKDIPIKAGTTNVMYDVPKIDLTAEDFRKGYLDTFTNMAKDIYAIGNQFLEVDRKIEENKEFIDVNKKIMEKRAAYTEEYENPEKINLGDATWRESRDAALKLLREEEFEIIRSSRINNMAKDKFAGTSNTYYMEKSVKNNMLYGEYTRQMNLSQATNNIVDSIELIGQTDNESEREGLVNSINNSRDILLKYGLSEADVNASIKENLKQSLAVASKNEIDMLFDNYDPDTAYQKAHELIGLNAQKYTALIGKVDGIKEEKAEEILKNYYDEQKDVFGSYISTRKKRAETNLKARERMLKKAQNNENRIRGYIKAGDSFSLAKELTGYNYVTSEMVNDNYTLKEIYGVDMEVLGDASDSGVGKIIAKEDIGKIKDKISYLKGNGVNPITAVQETVYDFVNSIAGNNEEIKNGMLKHIGIELDINPTVLIKGQEDDKYFTVQDRLNKGKGFKFEAEPDTGFFSVKGRDRYRALITQLGGSPKAKQALNSYLKGVFSTSIDPMISNNKNLLNTMPAAILKNFLEEDDYYEMIVKDLKYINELEVARINYDYLPVVAENFNVSEIAVNKIEDEILEKEEEVDMYEFK